MTLLEKKDFPSLLEDLSQRLLCRAGYRDMIVERSYTGTRDRTFNERVRSFPLQELRRLFRTFPVQEDRKVCGYLILDGDFDSRSPLISAALLGLRLMVRREMARFRRTRLFEENMLREILDGALTDPVDIAERLKLLGIPGDAPCFAMLVRHDEETSGFGESVENSVKTFFPHTLTLPRDGKTLCAVFPHFAMGEAAVRENLVNMKVLFSRRAQGRSVPAGVGTVVPSIVDLRGSADEARRALVLGQLEQNGDGLFLWKELGAVKVLGIIADTEEGRGLHDAYLQKIVRHDEKHNMNLLGTLTALEESNWNLRATAERLSFHINTIKYRYAKLCELLDADLKSSPVRFNVSLALRLHNVYGLEKNSEGDRAS